MAGKKHEIQFRVRYCETDQMGTFVSSAALDWFEVGRTELLRACGLPYAQIETRGVFCPVAEAYVKYLGRAQYDDLLTLTASAEMAGKVRVKFSFDIHNANGDPVASGYTVNAITNTAGKPIRPPEWFVEAIEGAD